MIGICQFQHNGPDGKPAKAPLRYIDAGGEEKEVCSSHFVACMKAEEDALRTEKRLERLEELRQKRLVELKHQ